ncbi:6-phosphogluconolactonase [Buchnera aphidicola (Panaphis juglandis)]
MKQIIYIVSAGNQSIEVWELLHTGKMNLIQKIGTNHNEGQPLSISWKRKKLYVGTRPEYSIITYDILKSGILKKIGITKIPYSSNYINIDDESNLLFCGYYHSGCITMHEIQNNHCPSLPIQIVHNIKGCHSIHIDSYHKILFIPALLKNNIYVYSFQKNSEKIFYLKKMNSIKCLHNSGPRHADIHKNNNFLYSLNEYNATIDVWKINHEFYHLQHIQNVNLFFSEMNIKSFWSSDIHTTKCGKYLYASDRKQNTITAFKINKDNTLNIINVFNTVQQPKSFVIDKHDKYLIVAGQKSNTVSVYNILKDNGFLKLLNTYDVGKNPTWITCHHI